MYSLAQDPRTATTLAHHLIDERVSATAELRRSRPSRSPRPERRRTHGRITSVLAILHGPARA